MATGTALIWHWKMFFLCFSHFNSCSFSTEKRFAFAEVSDPSRRIVQELAFSTTQSFRPGPNTLPVAIDDDDDEEFEVLCRDITKLDPLSSVCDGSTLDAEPMQ